MNLRSACTEKGKKYAQIAEGQVCVFTGNEKHNAGRVTARRSVSTENGSQHAGNAVLIRFANTIDKNINVSSVEPSKFANIKRGLGIAKYVTREVDVHTIDARVPVSNVAAVTFVPTIESGVNANCAVAQPYVNTANKNQVAKHVEAQGFARANGARHIYQTRHTEVTVCSVSCTFSQTSKLPATTRRKKRSSYRTSRRSSR